MYVGAVAENISIGLWHTTSGIIYYVIHQKWPPALSHVNFLFDRNQIISLGENIDWFEKQFPVFLCVIPNEKQKAERK